MADSQMRNEKINDGLVESLLQVNSLTYKMMPNISIHKSRGLQVDYFQESTYSQSRRMILKAQTGSAYVDPMNSYLTFKVQTVGGVGGFGIGSACNLLNAVYVYSRSGDEVTRLENANLYIKNDQRYSCPQEYFDTLGQVQGYPSSGSIINSGVVGTDNLTAGNEAQVVIPLQAIAGCFNPIGNKLLPPQFMEGLRIEIQLETSEIAFRGAAITGYNVLNPEIHWDRYDLMDQYRAKIQEIAAQRGLNILHKEAYHNPASKGNATTFNLEINKAASKALKLIAITVLQ